MYNTHKKVFLCILILPAKYFFILKLIYIHIILYEPTTEMAPYRLIYEYICIYINNRYRFKMVRLAKCKVCHRFLSIVQDTSPYSSHRWKFHCCGIEYYKCKHETCTHKQCHKLYYQDTHHLNKHIKKYHNIHNEKELPVAPIHTRSSTPMLVLGMLSAADIQIII